VTFSNFFDAFGDFDWVAILAGTLAFVVLGWLWYGLLFGKAWSSATGNPQVTGVPPVGKLVSNLVYAFVLNIGLAFLVVGPDSLEHAIVAGGIIVGVFIGGALVASAVVWSNYSTTAAIIDLLYLVVGLSLATWVQGLII
jgi:hypothetical protein